MDRLEKEFDKIDRQIEATHYHESGHAAVYLLSEDTIGAPSVICTLTEGDRLGFNLPSPDTIQRLSSLSPEVTRAYGRMLTAGAIAQSLAGFADLDPACGAEGPGSDSEKLARLASLTNQGPEFAQKCIDGAEWMLRGHWSGVTGIARALRECGGTLAGESGMELARMALYQKPIRMLSTTIEELDRLANSLLKNPDFADEIRRQLAALGSSQKERSSSRIPKPAPTRPDRHV